MINSLLSGGEIPGLFTREEIDQSLAPIKEEMAESGFYGSLYSYFSKRVREKLHVAVIMDSTDPNFEISCQKPVIKSSTMEV